MVKRTLSKKIGELLIERGIITLDQLAAALERQKQQGGYISQHLISLKYASESDIAVCLSNQYNFAYLPLKHYSIGPDILRLIPLKWIMIYTLIPVDKIGRVLSVVMADPLNEGVIRMLEEITNCEIQVFISTYGEIKQAINQYYSEELLKMQAVTLPDLGSIMIAGRDIQTISYSGIERRKYLRINMKLDLDYSVHGALFKTETINLSFTGLCFAAIAPISVDTDFDCRLHLNKEQYIECIVKVIRVENCGTETGRAWQFEIAGVFVFMGNEDKAKLIELLRDNV